MDKQNEIEIQEKDLIEKFILGTGKGGQKINKTSSCVYLKHIPTGIEIKCQSERSRKLNRQLARALLLKRLKEKKKKADLDQQQIKEKVKRQKRRPTKASQKQTLADKKEHSQKKRLRQVPKED